MMAPQAQRLLKPEEIRKRLSGQASAVDEWNYAPDFLDLPHWRTIAVRKMRYDIEVIAELLTLPICPDCERQRTKLRPNGTFVQSIKDESRDNRRVEIHFLRQRFECACGRNLLQPLAGVVKGRSITRRGALYTALECFHLSFDAAGLKVGVSSTTAKEVFADFICELEADRKIEAPKVLGIDGVCAGRRRHKRSYCMLTDISNSGVLELLKKSTELELARFLKQLPNKRNVKVVVIDMARGFLEVCKKILPSAVIVIDPYHVVSKLNDAVNAVVRMKLEGLTYTGHKQVMRGGNKFLLLARRFDLSKEQREQLDAWLETVPEIKLAYKLKEQGYGIYKFTRRRDAEKRFDDWSKSIPENLKPAFKSFLGAVKRWRPYIFNYFDYKFSNGYTESKNRDVKSLQRNGRRTSFNVLRARLLFSGVTQKPPRPKPEIKVKDIRSSIKKAGGAERPPDTWNPNSYVGRINQARKASNEFSRLLRPSQGWESRFGHYSYYSEEKSKYKWDFIW